MKTRFSNQLRINCNEGRLLPENGTTISMWQIVDEFKNRKIILPPHQRKKGVWTKQKIDGYIKRMIMNRPLGQILTYQITTENLNIFLNDGLQRINTAIHFLDNSDNYGFTKNEAIEILKSFEIDRRHKHYKNHHEEALEDFQQINYGTFMTPKEWYKGLLCYTDFGVEFFEEVLEPFTDFVLSNSAKISDYKTKDGLDKRVSDHKLIRETYSLICRWIDFDKYGYSYFNSGSSKASNPSGKTRGKASEIELRKLIDDKITNTSEFNSYLDKLKTFIVNETAFIQEIWHSKLKQPIGKPISKTLYFFILTCGIVKKNLNICLKDWEFFLTELINRTDGTAVMTDKEGKTKLVTFALGHSINKLKAINHLINVDIFFGQTRKRKKNILIKEGYDRSHIKPFSIFGDGETFPEPASINRSRGAEIVKEDNKPCQTES